MAFGFKNYGSNAQTFLQAVRMPWRMQNRLNQFAEKYGVTKTSVILRALDRYLTQYEPRPDEKPFSYTYLKKLKNIENTIENPEGGTDE